MYGRSEKNFEQNYGDEASVLNQKPKRKKTAPYRPTVVGVGNAILEIAKEPLKDMDVKARFQFVVKRLKLYNKELLEKKNPANNNT